MRTDSETQSSESADGALGAKVSEKMKAAMARMLAAAKARRANRKPFRGELRAALSPTRWRHRAGNWLPSSFGDKTAFVLPDPSPRAVDSEAQLVADALTRLAPAIGRAAVYGTPVKVTVPDDHTADVFREALSRTDRPTDRLVQVVVANA
ncbi:MAG TPA: hypothetical protein VL966_10275 [Alphaproteobacteria bacterium]|jgi:hypothetical protein|nr:hypothetical protein [Alphaproteobacteria bacterium]